MNRLHVYGRLLICKGLAFECVGHAACSVALWAFSKAREAEECSSIVYERAEAS